MMSSSPKNAAERIVETVAALCLGAAVALAIFELAPLSGGALAVAAMAGGATASATGFALLIASGGTVFATRAFDPVEFTPDDVLLLDDPVIPDRPTARVVQMFVPQAGEMVTRIDQFLETKRGAARESAPDASAALHAALAQIRQSLR